MTTDNSPTPLSELITKVRDTQASVLDAVETAKREIVKQEFARKVKTINEDVLDTISKILKAKKLGIVTDVSGFLLKKDYATSTSKLWSDAVDTLDKPKAEEFAKEVDSWGTRVSQLIHTLWEQECERVVKSIKSDIDTISLFNPSRKFDDEKEAFERLYSDGQVKEVTLVREDRWEAILEIQKTVNREVGEIGEIPTHVREFLKKLEQGSLTLAEYVDASFEETREWIRKHPLIMSRLVVKWGS